MSYPQPRRISDVNPTGYEKYFPGYGKSILPGTVGFEKLFSTLSEGLLQNKSGHPPYNIVKITDSSYAIMMAVAGYSKNDLSVELSHEGTEKRLLISGNKPDDNTLNILYQGIASRTFNHSFLLSHDVETIEARLENGILSVSLTRNLSEDKQKVTIPIAT